MTTTFATDNQVRLRSTLVVAAINAICAARAWAAGTADPITLDEYRVEAQRQIFEAFAAKGISEGQVTNADGVRESEVCLTLALVYEAATSRPNPRNPGAQDLYAQQAQTWREAAEVAMVKAQPKLNEKPVGASFEWNRG